VDSWAFRLKPSGFRAAHGAKVATLRASIPNAREEGLRPQR